MDTAESLLRQIAELDPIIDTGEGGIICRLCDGEDKRIEVGHTKHGVKCYEHYFDHKPNCLWVQASLYVEGLEEK